MNGNNMMGEEKNTEKILRDGIMYLLEEFYDGNISRMSDETGVSRAVITDIKQGKKSEVNSSTLIKFYQTGVNLNWLLTGEGKPFRVKKTDKGELQSKQHHENQMRMIRKLAEEIEDQLRDNPSLHMERDVQIALLRLIQSAVQSG